MSQEDGKDFGILSNQPLIDLVISLSYHSPKWQRLAMYLNTTKSTVVVNRRQISAML